MNRKPIFDAVRKLLGRGFTQSEVDALDRAIDVAEGALPAGLPPEPVEKEATGTSGRGVSPVGERLIKKWEGCHKPRPDGRFEAYPDPGSTDGRPWTIGWGATGPDVNKGVIWDASQCEKRFARDLQRYADEVAKAIGTAETTQNQFDALVSFHYNTGAIFTATLTKRHKAGDFQAACAEFGRWIYNDGRPMNGLKARRADEAKLYAAT